MSEFESQHHNLGDRQLETLLRDFFEGELPAELGELDDAPLVRRATQSAAFDISVAEKPVFETPLRSRWATRAARLLGAAVAVAGVLFLAWNVVPDARRHANQNPATQPQLAGDSGPTPSVAATGATSRATRKTVAPRELLSNVPF